MQSKKTGINSPATPHGMIISVIYSETKNTVTILKVAIKKETSTNQSKYLS